MPTPCPRCRACPRGRDAVARGPRGSRRPRWSSPSTGWRFAIARSCCTGLEAARSSGSFCRRRWRRPRARPRSAATMRAEPSSSCGKACADSATMIGARAAAAPRLSARPKVKALAGISISSATRSRAMSGVPSREPESTTITSTPPPSTRCPSSSSSSRPMLCASSFGADDDGHCWRKRASRHLAHRCPQHCWRVRSACRCCQGNWRISVPGDWPLNPPLAPPQGLVPVGVGSSPAKATTPAWLVTTIP